MYVKTSTIRLALSQIKPRHVDPHSIFKTRDFTLNYRSMQQKRIICGGTICWPLPYNDKEIYNKTIMERGFIINPVDINIAIL